MHRLPMDEDGKEAVQWYSRKAIEHGEQSGYKCVAAWLARLGLAWLAGWLAGRQAGWAAGLLPTLLPSYRSYLCPAGLLPTLLLPAAPISASLADEMILKHTRGPCILDGELSCAAGSSLLGALPVPATVS